MSLEQIANRRGHARMLWRMARNFGRGELTLGTPGQRDDDAKALEQGYRKMAVRARRSAMMLRRISLLR